MSKKKAIMTPYNFSFVVPNHLAGMGYPGIDHSLERDLQFLKSMGIGAIVSLAERKLNANALRKYQIEHLYLPIIDFAPPTLEQIEEFTVFTDKCIYEKTGVVVHCQEGIGRTGTMLACYLVKIGHGPSESICQIRNLRPGSIETLTQESVIYQYAAYLASKSCSQK